MEIFEELQERGLLAQLTDEKEIIIVSTRAQIKVKTNDISLLGKGAQGTKSIKMGQK